MVKRKRKYGGTIAELHFNRGDELKRLLDQGGEEFKGVEGQLKLLNQTSLAPSSLQVYPATHFRGKSLGWVAPVTLNKWIKRGFIAFQEGKGYHLTEEGRKWVSGDKEGPKKPRGIIAEAPKPIETETIPRAIIQQGIRRRLEEEQRQKRAAESGGIESLARRLKTARELVEERKVKPTYLIKIIESMSGEEREQCEEELEKARKLLLERTGYRI